MKRCAVLLNPGVVLIALLADAVSLPVPLPVADAGPREAVVPADREPPAATFCLGDFDGSLIELARAGRVSRDLSARRPAPIHTSPHRWWATASVDTLCGPADASSLVQRHTRLQI
jgi:hypothetical protein